VAESQDSSGGHSYQPGCLVRGRTILCKVLDDGHLVSVEDGAVLQMHGRIEAVGPYAELCRRYPDLPTIGSAHHVVMPGMVDAHHHVGLTPVQLGTQDLPLELWLTAQLRGRRPDAYLDTLYSAFELIASGVTAVQHLDLMLPRPVNQWPARGHAVIKAYTHMGMRVSYALCIRDQNRLVYADDASFLAMLPPELAAEAEKFLRRTYFALEEFETDFLQPMMQAYSGHPTVRIWLAPINLERCSDSLLMRCRGWAERFGIGIHLHLSETHYQKLYALRRWNKSAVKHLHDIGFLGPNLTLGHCVWATEEDLDLMASVGVCACHNASSNLRLRSGIAPIGAFIARGIPVALGIDEAGLNDDRDMLQEMRLVKHLHCVPGLGEEAIKPAQIFRMATENGARAIGFGDDIGTIEPGKRADLVLLDFSRLAAPYLDPAIPVLDAIVYRAKPEHVAAVMIDGEIVLQDGRFLRIDRRATMQRIGREGLAEVTPDDHARCRLAERLAPHLKAFYADWTLPRSEPFYILNARR
jgi:5-methylthioadenosine/S-adenosylhomocysteine deaminase